MCVDGVGVGGCVVGVYVSVSVSVCVGVGVVYVSVCVGVLYYVDGSTCFATELITSKI